MYKLLHIIGFKRPLSSSGQKAVVDADGGRLVGRLSQPLFSFLDSVRIGLRRS